jgi:hypothetical protein
MNNYNQIGIRFINDAETRKLFNELSREVQGKIVLDALKKVSKPILDQAKVNFKAVKKDLSKTNYSILRRSFKIESRRKTENTLGVKIGATKEGYKYRWIQWGTADRYTERTKKRAKAFRGSIKATNFFYSAVSQKMPDVKEAVGNEIKLSLERVMKKYS